MAILSLARALIKTHDRREVEHSCYAEKGTVPAGMWAPWNVRSFWRRERRRRRSGWVALHSLHSLIRTRFIMDECVCTGGRVIKAPKRCSLVGSLRLDEYHPSLELNRVLNDDFTHPGPGKPSAQFTRAIPRSLALTTHRINHSSKNSPRIWRVGAPLRAHANSLFLVELSYPPRPNGCQLRWLRTE